MNNSHYNMSFSTGGLFLFESVKLTELYLNNQDWDIIREKAISENLLQARTVSTSKRICREILSRLQTLSVTELTALRDSNHQEQCYILWLSICRYYRFIGEFAVEVLRERYISLKGDLNYEEFDFFFNKKSEWHSELNAIQTSTRKKLRQVLFKILREADLLTKTNTINAAMLSPYLLDLIKNNHHHDLLCFPAFESDLGVILN